jgi:hypothetical protein
MFSYQRNFFTPTKEVTPEQFWALVGAPYTKELIDGVRAAKARGDEAEAARLKKRLPAFIFQATFDETQSAKGNSGRWRKQAATRLNGLCVLDVDHVEKPCEVFQNVIIEKCKDVTMGILLVYVTPSGHGLKVVFKADPAVGNLIDNQLAMAKVLGVECDESCKDASRMSFICTKEDILFINEQELFTYENKEFAEKFEPVYRGGNSQPSSKPADRGADSRGVAGDGGTHQDGTGHAVVLQPDSETYHGVTYGDIIREWLGGHEPERGDRHTTLLRLARDLRYICDRNAEVVRRVLMQEQWVRDLMAEGDAVETTIKDACDYKYYVAMPKRLREVLEKVGAVEAETTADEKTDEEEAKLPLEAWGREIEELFDYYPCLREACDGQTAGCYPAVLFTTAAFLGTLMTRTTWHHWYDPDVERRLNYCVIIIGPPTSGKSFATRLYKLLAAPIKSADKVGYDAINRFKEEKASKADNKEKPKKPVVIIRDHPARTANGVFITDMVNAVETIDGKPMNLHMLTFDSELDNATLMSKGGQWIDKTAMELKAFHNEEDGQAYANLDSVSGKFNVYWNFVYTGTPVSLDRKVNERNFGTGLATRLAVIPMPDRKFQIAEYNQPRRRNQEADETLKTWAFHLDQVRGELPLEPLLRTTYDWLVEHEEVAAYDDDRAADMLLMRVPYYGISIAAPFILMRHWEEWKEQKTLSIDETDQRLCRLAMDIQYRCQTYYFGKYAEMFFDNLRTTVANRRQRASKYDLCYQQLPKEFGVEDVEKVYGQEAVTARSTCSRLCKNGFIERLDKGKYRKIKATLTS